jgi:hypothetical protein
MSATFQGIVERGQIRWLGIAPPEGAKVVVVAKELPSVEEQIARLQAIPPEEWERAFDEFIALSRQGPPPEEAIDELSDEELVAIVHSVREEIQEGHKRASRH